VENVTKLAPLRFDPEGTFGRPGVTEADLAALAPRLLEIRAEILGTDLKLFAGEGTIPPEKQPLDAGFLELPEWMLDPYLTTRKESELFQILRTAQELQTKVDRLVVLGIGGSYMGARAIIECCCDPFVNDLPAGERGGRPRIYFAGYNVDNDSTRGLLHLLRSTNRPNDPHSRWGMIVISKSGGTLETAAALRQFINAWTETYGREQLGEYLIPITGTSGKLANLADAIGCPVRFPVPEGVGGRFSVLSAVGLLPAAAMGVDVVKLLEGASAMNDHFRLASPGENTVLDYVAVNHLAERNLGCQTRILSAWSNALESTGLWYDQLLAESLGKQELGALPLTVVNTRDLHSRAQQHQEGRRDKLVNNLIVDQYRHDPLPVGRTGWNQDGLDDLAERTLPELMAAAIRGTNDAYQEVGRPTTDLHLPAANEASLGQLFQMLMLATVVEGRLLGINPYGQPGVEAYKLHMNRYLRQGS
jgi:glucose-6-phosphate isomerase